MTAKRVLIVRVGAMGDVLHALPAVAALHRARPEIDVGWAVDARWVPLLVNETGIGPLVSRVHIANTQMWSRSPFSLATFLSVLALRRDLRDAGYQQAVDMQGTLRSALIGRFACGYALSGYADPRERLAGAMYGHRITRRGVHVTDQGAALLGEAVETPLLPTAVDLPRSAAAEQWAEMAVDGFSGGTRIAMLAPTAGWGAKQWPQEGFGRLARRLASRGYTVLVNASRVGDPVCASVLEQSGGAARPLVCGLAELIEVTRRVSLVIGNDSGPVHLAAALGTPLIALFGPTDPARNGPWGPGTKQVLRDVSSITSHKRVVRVDPGLKRISVEDVLGAVEEMERNLCENG